MKCDKCEAVINEADAIKHLGKVLCEDCYMDVLSPSKTCDPWAVYTAKSMGENSSVLTAVQTEILKILKESGGLEAESLAEKINLTLSDLQREVATLRHMEKVKAAIKEDKKVICLW